MQGATLPLLIGGRSPAALRRVAREATFWQTTSAGPDLFPSLVAAIRAEPRGQEIEVGSVYAFSEGLPAAREAVRTREAAGAQHLSVNFGPAAGRLERMQAFAQEFGVGHG